MPVNYARDDVRRLITVSMHGPFDTRSLVDTLDRQVAEGTWAYARLYDERGVTVAPTSQQIRALLDAVRQRLRDHGPRGAVAVVTDQPAHFGMVRMYMTLAEEEPAVSVFRDPADAHRWLAERGHGPP
jgi:hypothetical protein